MNWKEEDNIMAIKELRFTHCPLYYIPNLTKNSGSINFIENRIGYFIGGRFGGGVCYPELKKYIESLRNAYTAFLPLFKVAPGAAMDILKHYSSMFTKELSILSSFSFAVCVHMDPVRYAYDVLETGDITGNDETPCIGFGFQELKI